ncbi:F-box/FBD/LRR-repeat protein At1g13570 isoform X2 [Cryptomeria japonica]|uniref:F-box/FBD/LRR-repeat protein At1g13570 isoform X2 n=1 Tax=Cryptomeria japonica TaxID=3369 RepID=UPI0027DA80B4|nr:F-box/FBD/LRR-repeat protein At1g13570 isoform X2 [Cryptomeria japonica]
MEIQIDRLSDLPDNLLCCNILSRLSLKDAIRASLLSHRWKTLWRNIPHIDFSLSFFDSLLKLTCRLAEMAEIKSSVKYVENVINNIILLHSTPLESVQFDLSFQGRQNRLGEKILNNVSIEQCIKGAAVKGVKRVALCYRGMSGRQVPSSLFACQLLRVLEIEGFWITEIPSDFRGFLFLKTCSLSEIGDLTDARLQQLIAVCPILEKLVIKRCAALFNLQICAPNLTYLNLGTSSIENFTADCPQLVELKIKDCFMLSKFELNSIPFLQEMEPSDISALEEIPAMKSLKKLSLRIGLDTPFGVLISTFPDLEELKITDILIQDMVAGDVASDTAFPKLKKADVFISSDIWGQKEVALLDFLLSNAPKLNSMALCNTPVGTTLFTDPEFMSHFMSQV